MSQPVAWARVVWASTVLSTAEKVVWEQFRILDNGVDGVWAHPETMARRCGMPLRTFEPIRTGLRRKGMLAIEGRARGSHWFCLLPPTARPESQRPTDVEIYDRAALLDEWLTSPGLLQNAGAFDTRNGVPSRGGNPSSLAALLGGGLGA